MEKSNSETTCSPEKVFFSLRNLHVKRMQCCTYLFRFLYTSIQFSHWNNIPLVEIAPRASKLLSLELPQIMILVILLMESEIREFGLNIS